MIAKASTATTLILAAVTSVLALADGVLHLMLDSILFHGRFWGAPSFGPPPGAAAGPSGPPPGPPPGAPAPPSLPLPLNELFVLNCLGFVGLVAALWIAERWFPAWAWLVDAALILMSAASIAGWFYFGEPNPHGLGYLSKVMEIAIIALIAVRAFWPRQMRGPAEPAGSPRQQGAAH